MNVYENPIDLSINNSYNDCPITPKTVKRQIIFEHSYCNCPSKELLTTPKRGRPQTVVTPRKVQFKYRIKRLSQQVRRLKSKITNLKELLRSIKKRLYWR